MLRDDRGRFSGSSADEIVAELDRAIADATIELCLEVESNVREATPIRTGHAAASWTDSIGDPVSQDADSPGAAAARAAEGRARVLGYQLGMGNLNVGNPTDYIEFLNGGSSDQAPAQFIERGAEQALQTVQTRHDSTRRNL